MQMKKSFIIPDIAKKRGERKMPKKWAGESANMVMMADVIYYVLYNKCYIMYILLQ